MVTICKSLERECGSEGVELFSVARGSNRMRLAEGNFRFDIKDPYFSEIDSPLTMGCNSNRAGSQVRCGADKPQHS